VEKASAAVATMSAANKCPDCGGPTTNTIEDDSTDFCDDCVRRVLEAARTRDLSLLDPVKGSHSTDAEKIDRETGIASLFGKPFAEIFFPDNESVPAFGAMGDTELYAACRTNGSRATKYQMAAFHEAMVRIVREISPCTVRQAYYQATVRGVVDKTEAGYDRVQRALVELRRSGRVSYRAITDNTRWQIKPNTSGSVQDALEQTAQLYRRTVWADVPAYVECWLEKDALAGVVQPVTAKYDVPLMVARGFSSLSFLHSAGEDIAALHKPAYIYHLGDRDPSGVCAGDKIEQTLRKFAPKAEIHFTRLAVLPEQIKKWKLPTRPTKKSDSRAKNFQGDSVELDAIHPDRLRKLVEDAILEHLPADQLQVLEVAEQSEREMLRMFAKAAGSE
jgi:hypothetical protein